MHANAARGGGPCTNDVGRSQGLAQKRFISAYLFLWRVSATLPKAIAPPLRVHLVADLLRRHHPKQVFRAPGRPANVSISMRFIRTFAAVFCLIAASQAIGADALDAKPKAIPDVEIKATVSTASAYGEQWSLHITRDGLGYFRYDNYRKPPGELSGEFLFGLDAVSRLEALAQAQSFETLPERMAPALLMPHGAEYRISIQRGLRRHEVRVTEPDRMDPTAELARFREVWNAIWSQLPFKPPTLPGNK